MRSYSFHVFTAIFCILLLAACGQKTSNTPQQDGTNPNTANQEQKPEGQNDKDGVTLDLPPQKDYSTPQEVATTDQPIPLPARATGISIWDHPSLTFQSLILAATPNGIYAHTLEGNEEISAVNDINANNIALTFWNTQAGQAPTRQNVQAIFTTYDETNKAFRLFRINDKDTAIKEDLLSIKYADPVTSYCMGVDPDAEHKAGALLMVLSGSTITSFTYDTAPTLSSPKTINTDIDNLTACAIDNRSGEIYVANKRGNIYKFNEGQTEQTPIIQGQDDDIISFSILHNQFKAADENQNIKQAEIQSQFALLSEKSGLVRLYDVATNNPLGILQFAQFNSNEGVLQASAMGIGHGNYGGIYRFGVIALAASGNQPAVRLTPYIGAARALDLKLTNSLNPRDLLIEKPSPTQTLIGLDKVRTNVEDVFPDHN